MSGGFSQYAASLAENDDDSDMEYEPAATSNTDDGITDLEILEESDEDEGIGGDDSEYEDAVDIAEGMIQDGMVEEDEDGNIMLNLADPDDDEDEEEDEDDEDDDEDGAGEGMDEQEDADEAQTAEDEELLETAIPTATAPAAAAEPQTRTIQLTRQQLVQLIMQSNGGGTGLAQLFGLTGDDDEEEEEEEILPRRRFRRQQELRPHPPKTFEPQPAGSALMESGLFGINNHVDGLSEQTKPESQEGQLRRRKKVATRIMQRELGLGSPGKERSYNRLVSQELLPSTKADTIINYEERCYSGQFSEDGNFFFSCCQDFRVRMYDTSNPYSWRHYKTVPYLSGAWTITDATLSPDNKYLASSTMAPIVALANTDPDTDSEPYFLDFSDMHGGSARGTRMRNGRSSFAIFSVRFSGDGTEIVAGTNSSSIFVYDLESRKSIVQINGHDDEVNAVCYGDKAAPHILYSGSDDSTIKVWDRRSLGDGRPAGVMLGHTEGVTYIDSKGDGRYVLSNGKDQTMKLWDLRKMHDSSKADDRSYRRYMNHDFDYRGGSFEDHDYKGPHADDCSVVTYRGHKVMNTLIRCHFSPPGSTDSRYVYSGSADGSVYIYNMDATLAKKIDVLAATKYSRPKPTTEQLSRNYWSSQRAMDWDTCIRDVAWHPTAPVIAATSWNGYGRAWGTCTTHTWNDGVDEDEGEPKMGLRVNAKLQRDPTYYGEPPLPSAAGSRRARRMYRGDDDDQ